MFVTRGCGVAGGDLSLPGQGSVSSNEPRLVIVHFHHYAGLAQLLERFLAMEEARS